MTERVDTIVRGGLVATSTGEYHASIAIRGEQIVAVGPDDTLPEADEYVDATGKHVLPGAIDCHVHLRDAPNDDWDVGSVAAARAGLTTIIPFGAYDAEARETLPQAIERWKGEAARDSVVDYTFHYILSNTPLHHRRPRRGHLHGRHVFQDVHDLRPPCIRLLHRPGDGDCRRQRRDCAASRREWRRDRAPDEQGHRRGPHRADGLPRHLPHMGRGGGNQPRRADGRNDRLPRSTSST